jgi:hypothetical protein
VLRAILKASVYERREGLLVVCAHKRRPTRRPGGQRLGKEAGKARVGPQRGVCRAIEQRVLGRFRGAGGAPTAVVEAAVVQREAAAKGSEQQLC